MTSADRNDSRGATYSIGTWQYASFTVVHFALVLLLRIVGLRGLYRFGCLFGLLEWMINYKRRRRYARALGRMLGDEFSRSDRRRITRSHFMQTRCDKMFYLVLDAVPTEEAAALLTIDKRDLLDEAIARGHGVCLAYSHQGPLHVFAMLMAMSGFKTVAVRNPNEAPIRRYVQRRLDRRCKNFRRTRFLFNDTFPREIYRCLQDGYMVGSALDASRKRHPNQRAENAEIFGECRPVLTGPLYIAFRCKAPVLQAFAVAEPYFRYRMHITGMLIDPDEVDDADEIMESAIETYASNVEAHLRRQPNMITRP